MKNIGGGGVFQLPNRQNLETLKPCRARLARAAQKRWRGYPPPRCFAQRVRNLLKINYLVETAVQKSAEEYQNKGDEYETLMEHTVNGKLSQTQTLRDHRNGLIVASPGSDCLGGSRVNGALK